MTLHSSEGKLLRGDQAIAAGALAAGVSVVTGYPGSPATGVFDSILAAPERAEMHVQWAPNEKVAMELAFGASLGGSRALVVLKSVGMNIALDPLATVSLTGCHAGLVILLGDDPGGWASQNEQDSRWAALIAEVPVVEPTSVEQAASLMVETFAQSESLGLPIIVRVTRALSLAHGSVQELGQLPRSGRPFLRERNRWIALPAYVVESHQRLHRKLVQMREAFEAPSYQVRSGVGSLGVLAVGYTHAKVSQALSEGDQGFRLFGLAGVWPLPCGSLTAWLRQLDRVLVLEEGGPFVEQQVRALAQREALRLEILGKENGVLPEEGELTEAVIAQGLSRLTPSHRAGTGTSVDRAMPSKVPLCDDCLYRPTFEALLRAMGRHGGRRRHLVVGETGCMVRANLPPMELFDVKYSLGSGLGMAMGLALSDKHHKIVALLGDSSFFHSDVNAMPYAAQLNLPILVVVLDNGTTALTGGQPHPGSALDELGRPRTARANLADVIRGCGVEPLVFSGRDESAIGAAVDEAMAADELRVVIVRAPCPRYVPRE